MVRRLIELVLIAAAALAALGAPRLALGQYRGMATNWPFAAGGYSATYPSTAAGQPSYVARPAAAPRGVPMAYVPVTAAYANPNYFAGYAAGQTAQRPQLATAAYYAPQANAAYYAPQAGAAYAPAQGYSVSPSGSSYAGSEAAAYYGQPAAVNYVPPRFSYRPTYAAVPVYAYRPVTVYDPVSGQPTTCLQPAATTSCCQEQRCKRGFLSFLNPFNWFKRDCEAKTTAYCGSAAPTSCYNVSQCGAAAPQPYYPSNVIPSVPAPTTTIPSTTIPSIRSPIIGQPTVPAPPTRTPGTGLPADTAPSLSPGAIIRPGTSVPSGGGSFTPSTAPSSGFGVPPASVPGGSFPSGSNYPPETDPYRGPAIVNPSGASYRSSTPASESAAPAGAIREPGAGRLAPGVKTIPDPDAEQPQPAQNRAPQLLSPRDKMARAALNRWAVVPAIWPTQNRAGQTAAQQPDAQSEVAREPSPYLQAANHNQAEHRFEPVRHFVPAASTPVTNSADYDDGGWQSAR